MSLLADYCLTQMGLPRFQRRQTDNKSSLPEPKTNLTPVKESVTSTISPPLMSPAPRKVNLQAVNAEMQMPTPVKAKKTETEKVTPSQRERQEAINACTSLEMLVPIIQACRHCDLCQYRQQAVIGAGVGKPTWLLVGEAPGAEEDEQGVPFVGNSGKLLSGIFASFGISREPQLAIKGGSAYITNAIKCRPTGNRTPTVDEIAMCRPFLEKQIELLAPKIIMAVGRVATIALVGDDKTLLGKMRSRVLSYSPATPSASRLTQEIPVVVTYHPAYLIRNPSEKRKSWDDISLAINVLRERNLTNI